MVTLSWIAMCIALFGSLCVGSDKAFDRFIGFCAFMVSNVLWMIFAFATQSWPLFIMNMAFTVTSLRGLYDNREG